MKAFNQLSKVPGFKFGGFPAGLKENNEPDVGILLSENPCTAAAAFTRNEIKAEPVKESIKNMEDGTIQLVLVNSKNANACTGKQGADAVQSLLDLGVNLLNVQRKHIFLASTGVIGREFPIKEISKTIIANYQQIANNKESSNQFAKALLTTDTVIKGAYQEFTTQNPKTIHMAGVAKGSGMIHPNMGTMLSFIICDVAIEQTLLNKTLNEIVEDSFNMISVDGDTSTNDCVLVLCNGAAGNEIITEANVDFIAFKNALKEVCTSLAKQIVADGEGITKMIEYKVERTSNDIDAKKIIKTIATSLLVKTAFFGEDPNWGRILGALGRAGVPIKTEKINLYLGDQKQLSILINGEPSDLDIQKVKSYMKNKLLHVTLDLGLGKGSSVGWGTDLTNEYVTINGHYTT